MKNLIKIILLFFVFTSSAQAFHKFSMRRCLILPVTDYVGGAIGFKVFEGVENYLKGSEWCFYKSNSEILNILGNYKKDLDKHLKNPEVLRILSEKTKSGSLIRIQLENVVKGIRVTMEIVGENGDDVYFREQTELNTQDAYVISQTVKNWLDNYEKTIPYDGRIMGVLGDQYTMDIGKIYGVEVGQKAEVYRPTRRKRHPLLKEIVEWEKVKIGKSDIFYVAKSQGQGKMTEYNSEKKVQLYDWVKLVKTPKQIKKKDGEPERVFYPDKKDDFKFGKLGIVGIFLNLGNGSATTTLNQENVAKMGGFLLGVDLRAEIWATRNYWASFEIGRKFGTFSQEEGTLSTTSNSMSEGVYKFKAGYRYLPMGFFYGPQVDGYLGYANYNYGLDNQASDGFGEVSFKGFLLGVKGSLPIMRDVRAYIMLDFILGANYEEDITIYGEADSVSNYNIEIGGVYKYSPTMNIEGGINFASNKAKFVDPEKTYSFKDTGFKIGTTFAF